MELIVPESGSVSLHLYLPSGALLELQVYFKAGEDAKAVLSQLMDAEGLPASMLPDALSILQDIFQLERERPISPIKLQRAKSASESTDDSWRDYSRLFESPSLVAEVKAAEKELQGRQQQAEEAYYATLEAEEHTADRLSEGSFSDSDLQAMVMAHADKLQQVAKDFERAKLQIKEDYWGIVRSLKSSERQPEEVKAKAFSFSQEFEVSIGAQVRRKVTFGLIGSDDPCEVPPLSFRAQGETGKARKTASSQLMHPDNVYKRLISCMIVPCVHDSRGIQTMTELVRRCEGSAEFHFPTIREQLAQTSKAQGDTFFFTRHSNLHGTDGVFHIPSSPQDTPPSSPSSPKDNVRPSSLLKAAIQFADQHSVIRVCFPIEEWQEKHLSPEALMRVVKAALYERQSGSIRSVLFTTEGQGEARIFSQLHAVFQ